MIREHSIKVYLLFNSTSFSRNTQYTYYAFRIGYERIILTRHCWEHGVRVTGVIISRLLYESQYVRHDRHYHTWERTTVKVIGGPDCSIVQIGMTGSTTYCTLISVGITNSTFYRPFHTGRVANSIPETLSGFSCTDRFKPLFRLVAYFRYLLDPYVYTTCCSRFNDWLNKVDGTMW